MEVPSQGGHTLYANGFRAHGALPKEMKRPFRPACTLLAYRGGRLSAATLMYLA